LGDLNNPNETKEVDKLKGKLLKKQEELKIAEGIH